MQVSVAALAVAFRSYVTSLTRTKTQEACNRVTEIWNRWQSAVDHLAPIVDLLPAFLIISIALFVAGLVDNILAASSGLEGKTAADMDAGATICIIVFGDVVCILIYTIVHAIIESETSPFPSAFADFVSSLIKNRLYVVSGFIVLCDRFHAIPDRFKDVKPNSDLSDKSLEEVPILKRWIITYYHRGKLQSQEQVAKDNNTEITHGIIEAYKGIMCKTFDDDLLDDGTSALGGIFTRWEKEKLEAKEPRADPDQAVNMETQRANTSQYSMLDLLEYLLSPTASRRSALTAAKIICDYCDRDDAKERMSRVRALAPLR
jgi:hypothetical protein